MSMKQIKLGMVICYYLQNEGGNILIDTGYVYDKALFLRRLAEEEISIGDITYILLTHHHDDHCGR